MPLDTPPIVDDCLYVIFPYPSATSTLVFSHSSRLFILRYGTKTVLLCVRYISCPPRISELIEFDTVEPLLPIIEELLDVKLIVLYTPPIINELIELSKIQLYCPLITEELHDE